MASINAVDLGLVEEMTSSPAAKALQVNSYPGVNGLEVLDGGARGGTSSCKGWLAGTSASDLASIQGGFDALQIAGTANTLIDDLGTSWPTVILTMFRPIGPRIQIPGGVAQRYDAEFLHLA